MPHPTLLADLHSSPDRFQEHFPDILRVFAAGEITEWVIQYGTYFERAAWAGALLAATSADGRFLSHADMVHLFGRKWADRFRLGTHRIRQKITRHLQQTIA